MTILVNLFFLSSFIPIGFIFFNMPFRKFYVSFISFILGVSLCTFAEIKITHSSLFLFPISLICIALSLFLIFDTQVKYILICEFSSYFVIAILYQFVRFICSLLFMKINIYSQFSVLIQSIIVFLIIFSVSGIVYSKRTINKQLSLAYLLFFSVVIIIDGSVIIVIGDFLFNYIAIISIPLTLTIYILLILGILIQIILLTYTIKSRDLHKENELLARQYLENQTRYYEYLVQREEDTRKFRHDIRNHISMLNMLFQENKIDECKDYLQNLTAHYENIHNAISVNNCIADAILNKYYYEAQNHDIELTVTGHFPSECSLPAYDICTVFSNLLENALKAVIDCGGKDISVGCRYTDTEILLSIENDSDYVELDADGMPRTSKNDVSQHGFGLKNVQQCVRQNNGHMSIQTNDKRFKVILSLSRGNDNESCNNR